VLQRKYRTRIQYTETDKALMWERWREGESLQRIAQLFDRNHSAIGGILSRTEHRIRERRNLPIIPRCLANSNLRWIRDAVEPSGRARSVASRMLPTSAPRYRAPHPIDARARPSGQVASGR
jgi:hypothetical protein